MSLINPYVDKMFTGILLALGVYVDLFLNSLFHN